MLKTLKKWFFILNYPKEWEGLLARSASKLDKTQIELQDHPWEWLHNQEDKNLCFLYALCKCEDFFKNQTALGIPENILIDTVQEIRRHTKKYIDQNGNEQLGIFQIKWVGNVLSGRLFCLGRLEFEMTNAKTEIEKYGIKIGDRIINVHIPGTKTPIDRESVDRSFSLAYDFFDKYFPSFDYKGFTCYSWLMDVTLRELLPGSSNIVGFLGRFDAVSSKESDSALKHVFDRNATYENFEQYTPKTSLQKAMIEHIRNGRKLYMTLGYKQK